MDLLHSLAFLQNLKQWGSIVLLGGMAVMIALEIVLPQKGYRWNLERLRHAGHNLLLWVAGVVIASVVFGGSIWYLLQLMQFYRIGILYLIPMPGWLLAILAFLLIDVCDYLFHRLSHNVRWLWLLHSVHHSDRRIDVTTNLRQHPLHLIATELWKVLACVAIGVPAWVFLMHEIINIACAHCHHAAVRWPRVIDRAFSWILITPRLHWNHHSPELPRTNSNFGVIFSLWDRWFGTYTPPVAGDAEFGLSALDAPSWQHAWGMLLTPWRARKLRQL
jgi:sterol desaturase/sphingolipid hydroxylase (fatty acid hydroxylase superfamily)